MIEQTDNSNTNKHKRKSRGENDDDISVITWEWCVCMSQKSQMAYYAHTGSICHYDWRVYFSERAMGQILAVNMKYWLRSSIRFRKKHL